MMRRSRRIRRVRRLRIGAGGAGGGVREGEGEGGEVEEGGLEGGGGGEDEGFFWGGCGWVGGMLLLAGREEGLLPLEVTEIEELLWVGILAPWMILVF